MLPLTGTSDPEHMVQDLASHAVTLSPDEVRTIGRSPADGKRGGALIQSDGHEPSGA